jgi:chromosome segregation ATPase
MLYYNIYNILQQGSEIMNVITEDKIIEAAEALAAAGKNPTQVTVREALGGGSFATIGPALKRWKDGQREDHALAEIRVPEAVTERLVQLQGAVWQVAVDEAERRLIAEREALKVAQDAAAAEVAEQLEIVAMLEAEAAEQAQRISNLEENENGLSVHIHNLSTELATAKQEHKAAAHAALDEIAAAAIRTDAAVERAQRAETLHDTAQAQARTDLADLKKEHKTDMATLKQEMKTTANEEVKQADIRAQEQARRADQAEQRETATAERLQGQIDELKKEVAEVRQEVKAAHQATAGEADKWGETVTLEHKRNEELTDQITAITAQNKELMAMIETPKTAKKGITK